MVKALRGGVQDVAVKQLLHTNAAAVEKFLEVSKQYHRRTVTASREGLPVKCVHGTRPCVNSMAHMLSMHCLVSC